MKILMLTSSSNSELGWCEHAFIELSPQDRKDILERRELYQMVHSKASNLWSLVFWDNLPGEFYEDLDLSKHLTEKQLEEFDDERIIVLPDEFTMGDAEPARTECDRLVVEEREFYYKAIVKHTDVYVQTPGLKYDLIK